jgi:Right handed beta helix region
MITLLILTAILGADFLAESSPALRAMLVRAKPGDRILVAPGEYAAVYAENIAGTAEEPIVITALDPKSPPVFRGGVHFSDLAHVEISHLVIEGSPSNGLNLDDAGSFDTPSHHITLRNLVVRDCGGRGNDDGIKLSGLTDFVIEDCTIERWGRGGSAIDMVGCARGVIERCFVRDREGDLAATGVQAKGGSRDITIRASRFEHAGQRAVNLGGSTGLAYFRPNPEGFEAKDVVVEHNVFVGSLAPVAFVGIDGAIVRHNTIVSPQKWVARILQESTGPEFVACRNGVFERNLVVYRSEMVRETMNVGPGTAPETFRFVANYWFCLDAATPLAPRLPSEEVNGVAGLDPQFRAPDQGDFALREGSPALGYGANSHESK